MRPVEAMINCGLGQEIFQSLPIFFSGSLHIDFDSVTDAQRSSKSSDRSVRRAIERGSEGDMAGKLVEGTKGTQAVPLSKLNGTPA
jgi:hypothetical protein